MFSLLTTFALIAMAIFQVRSAVPLPGNCDRNATVAYDDTCSSISAKYNVSTFQLLSVNTGIIDANCDNLYPGEVICLGLAGQDCNATYVVCSGDTGLEIANLFGISQSTLSENNPNINPGFPNLYPGEVLCVSSTPIYKSTGSS